MQQKRDAGRHSSTWVTEEAFAPHWKLRRAGSTPLRRRHFPGFINQTGHSGSTRQVRPFFALPLVVRGRGGTGPTNESDGWRTAPCSSPTVNGAREWGDHFVRPGAGECSSFSFRRAETGRGHDGGTRRCFAGDPVRDRGYCERRIGGRLIEALGYRRRASEIKGGTGVGTGPPLTIRIPTYKPGRGPFVVGRRVAQPSSRSDPALPPRLPSPTRTAAMGGPARRWKVGAAEGCDQPGMRLPQPSDPPA